MRIAISGYNGFVGTPLSYRLEKLGYEIIRISRSDGLDLSAATILNSVPKFNLFIHLAANSYVPASYQKPQDFYHNNIVSTLNALELCRRYSARMVFLSSYVYGVPQYLPIDEEHPLTSVNPYAESKIICERLCQSYTRDFGVPVTIFRPFNIYGKGQGESFLIPTILRTSKSGKIELKDSRPRRDFIYIDDIIQAIILSINIKAENSSIFNLGFGKSYSIKELLDIIKQKLPYDVEVHFTEERRPNEVLDTVSNIEKAKKEMGWTPQIDLEQGISLII